MALPNNPTQAQVVAEVKRLESDKYDASNPNGYTSNTGTVTSVRVQAGTGLSSSQSTAQTGTLNTTIGIASGYKLPTTTEWNAKADTSDIPTDYVTTDTAQTISGAKTLSTDLTFNASVQTQLIYKTNGTTTGLIRSGISNVGKYMVTQADQHYWGNIANENRIIYDATGKALRPETNGNIALGTATIRWNAVYSNLLRSYNTVPNIDAYMTGDAQATKPSAAQSAQYLARDSSGNWMGGLRYYHTTGDKSQTQLIARSPKTSTYSTGVMLEQDASATDNNQAGTCRFIPFGNGRIDLGASGAKWRNIYGVNVYATSDRRLKENIKDAELDCGKVIDELPIKEFNFKSDEEKKVVVGAIAQELQEILPEKYRATLVSGSEDTSYSINEGKLLYVAIGALKEERAKTKELEERLARLEAKLGV